MLSVSKQKSVPWLPFAYWGWRLTVEIPGDVTAGRTYRIPGEATAVLWSSAHHPGPPARDVSGTMHVQAATADTATVLVDLHSPSTGWTLQRRKRFKPARRPLPGCN